MTTTAPAARFEVLHALKVKGLASDDVLSAMSGLTADELTTVLESLTGDGLALRRDAGRISGTMLTPAGRDEYDRLGAGRAVSPEAQQAVADFYDSFTPVNTDFKAVCAAWQMRPDGAANDHTDADYDAGVVSDLGAIHERIAVLLDRVGPAVPRLGRYRDRLAGALGRVQAGDQGAFARPMYDSYHDIWMELHQDLLLTAGRERGAGDE
ncbi:MarR family transcriptional regulator [Gordonia caeni]|uniref:MarR family transcriptional regulator n=1 Tax=Gordonia caeni TaxID=1007097 RepID=A0ABP7NNB3_9ACTN